MAKMTESREGALLINQCWEKFFQACQELNAVGVHGHVIVMALTGFAEDFAETVTEKYGAVNIKKMQDMGREVAKEFIELRREEAKKGKAKKTTRWN